MIVEFVLTNSTLNCLKWNCHMDPSQIINKYDYIVILIDYLRGIHMTIPFQTIQR